jgi:mono/diheme cytochrome c family protein
MKKSAFLLLLLIPLAFLFPECYYDNVTDLYPAFVKCDTTNVTYSQTIAPIMTANCNSCHNTATASAGIITDTWAGLSGPAADGTLWKGVDQQPGISPMPKGGSRLSSCDLSKIKTWIDAGAPNN